MSDTRNHTTRDQLAAALYGLTWTSEYADAEDEIQESYRDRADELLASDAIAAVRAAAVAETTAAIEAAFDPGELDCGRVGMTCLDVYPADRWCRPCRIRAALSGGRTALDTTLAQARAELREQIARGIEDSRDRNQGNPAALAYLTHAAAIARHGRVEGADQ